MSGPFLFCLYPNDNKIQISHNPSLLKYSKTKKGEQNNYYFADIR